MKKTLIFASAILLSACQGETVKTTTTTTMSSATQKVVAPGQPPQVTYVETGPVTHVESTRSYN